MLLTRGLCAPKCPRYNHELKNPCLWGSGNTSAELFIVGRDPGQKEDKRGKVFIGRSGQLLDHILDKIGVDREQVYITNAVKCGTPKEDKEPGKSEMTCCRNYLFKEIEQVKPNVVVAFGNTALDSLMGRTGVTKIQNHVLFNKELGVKVIPVLHPAYALRNPADMKNIEKGMTLAVKESTSKEILYRSKIKTKYLTVKNANQAKQVLDQLEKVDKFAVDIEASSLDYFTSKKLSIQFSWKEGLGVTIPWPLLKGDVLSQLKRIMVTNKLKIGHNLKFDIQNLLVERIPVKKPFFDTIVAHSLIDDNLQDQSLDAAVLRYTDMGEYWAPLDEFKKQYCKKHGIKDEDFSYDWIPKEILYEYGAKDADAGFRFFGVCERGLKEEEQEDFFKKYSTPFTPILLEMEYRGIKIDRPRVKKLITEYTIMMQQHESEVKKDPLVARYEEWKTRKNMKKQIPKLRQRRLASKIQVSRFPDEKEYIKKYLKKKPHTFNMNSAPQLQELFFKMLKIEPIKLTKGARQPSADKEVMEILATEHGISVATRIDKFRKSSGFLSNFLNPVYEKSARDGRIHTSYMQFSVDTGRLSSRNPNLQNLPRDAIEFKSCFLADPGYAFVKADLAQAEFRVWAACSQDEDMTQDIEQGLDIHRRTASEVFGISEDEVTDHQRTAAKRGTFGMMYGIGAKSLSHQFKISLKQANSISEVFAARYPVAVKWIKKRINFARAHKFVKSWMGRKRRLPHIDSEDYNVVAKAERQAMNSPIQAAASDMNNYYMTQTIPQARKAKIDCYPAMTTHDENAIQVKKSQAMDLCKLMKKVVAESFPEFGCKMELEFKVGNSIGTAKLVEV